MTTTTAQIQAKGHVVAVGTLLIITALAFGPASVMKLTGAPAVLEGFARVGIPQGAIVPIGIIEMLCLLIYLLPRTAVLGTFLLTGYLGGAIVANIVGGTDFVHALVLGLVVWVGTWLRVPQLQALTFNAGENAAGDEMVRGAAALRPILNR